MTSSIGHITFDCADAAAVGTFWSAAIGRPLDDGASPQFAAIGFGAAGDQLVWLFIQVPEPKTAKNRMHLDMTTEDRDAEVERLVALGATNLGEHEEYGHHWVVLQDPEGNEFCVASAG